MKKNPQFTIERKTLWPRERMLADKWTIDWSLELQNLFEESEPEPEPYKLPDELFEI